MIQINPKSISRKEFISIEFFYNNGIELFKLTLHSDKSGFQKKIQEQNLHRPGLALAGFVDLFSYNRVQIFGNTEMSYLSKLSDKDKTVALERFLK